MRWVLSDSSQHAAMGRVTDSVLARLPGQHKVCTWREVPLTLLLMTHWHIVKISFMGTIDSVRRNPPATPLLSSLNLKLHIADCRRPWVIIVTLAVSSSKWKHLCSRHSIFNWRLILNFLSAATRVQGKKGLYKCKARPYTLLMAFNIL